MTPITHLVILTFLFLLGACVGSFLNVVIWRLPRDESLVHPGSHCPNCQTPLSWYDNIPILGWLKLHGKCRFCATAISKRYPIVEAVTAVLFVSYYAMFYLTPSRLHLGFCAAAEQTILDTWPMFLLYLYLLAALLAASLIDAEYFIIPTQIIWSWKGGVVVVAVVVHTLVDEPGLPGAISASALPAALAAGGAVGLLLSLLLLRLGKLPLSFAGGGPLLDIERAEHDRQTAAALEEGAEQPPAPPEYTPRQIRAEMRKEMLFLVPPLFCAFVWMLLTWQGGPLHRQWDALLQHRWLGALLGSALGGLVGGFLVWLTRILGTLAFGREAMGMGDVDLMAAVGAVLGPGPAIIAFFIAPFFGLAVAVYLFFAGRRELPYGPYLSLATAAVMLFYRPIAEYLSPLSWLVTLLQHQIWGR
jgi:leader peptidase (prepilin peptidase)/N-methyltransferase